jgi:signal transduction histidine kinase
MCPLNIKPVETFQEEAIEAPVREAREAAAAKFMEIKERQPYSERLSAISHFSSEVAHHINNSLTPIICYAQMLEQGQATPQQRKRLGKIIESAYRAKELIDGLMAFAEGQPTQVLPMDLSRIVRETLAVAHDLLWLPLDQVKLDLTKEAAVILGDQHQITQALLHLLKNAFQATSNAEREITLKTFVTPNGRTAVEVSDNGSGIPATNLPKVLLPFFTTLQEGGVGLGLSIVHGIAEAHGAALDILTEEGRGTTVRITFPTVETAARNQVERIG